MIDVLVVDDQADMRLLIRMTIEAANGGLRVCGAASSGPEAVALATEQCPTVIVLDQMMPGSSGLDVTDDIRAACPHARILLFSAYLDDAIRQRATTMDVPCLSKDDLGSLPAAIRQLAA